MRNDKEKAFELRRKGKSYKYINQKLGIPLGTLVGWFKNLAWSEEIKNQLSAEVSFSSPKKVKSMAEANKRKWSALYETYRKEADEEFEKQKTNPLFISGIMLYWAIGNKSLKTCQLKLNSAEPEIIRFFYRFLQTNMTISRDKIFASLVLYPDLNNEMQKRLWTKLTDIPLQQFKKSAIIKTKQSSKRLSYGSCSVVVFGRQYIEKMMRWIELVKAI